MFAVGYTPTHRGFDSHYGYYQGAEGYFDHTYEASDVSYSCGGYYTKCPLDYTSLPHILQTENCVIIK